MPISDYDCCPTHYGDIQSQSLIARIKRMKANKYITKEIWEAKSVFIIETNQWYSYAEIDRIINN